MIGFKKKTLIIIVIVASGLWISSFLFFLLSVSALVSGCVIRDKEVFLAGLIGCLSWVDWSFVMSGFLKWIVHVI